MGVRNIKGGEYRDLIGAGGNRMIQWKTPEIKQIFCANIVGPKWWNVKIGGNVFLLDYVRRVDGYDGYRIYLDNHNYKCIICDEDITIGEDSWQTIHRLYHYPDLRALVAAFVDSGDPTVFAAIYDYILENIPEFLES